MAIRDRMGGILMREDVNYNAKGIIKWLIKRER